MFGSEVLDVLIGMAFIYLLLSLIASAVREGLESVLKARAVHLERAIRAMLDDETSDGLVRDFYNHPLVYSLFPGSYNYKARRKLGRTLPTYIPPKAFAAALVDIAARGPAGFPLSVYDAEATELTVQRLRSALPFLSSERVARLLTMATDGARDIHEVIGNIEHWFNDSMNHVSALYRRRTQWGLLIIAVVIVSILNVDSIAIANHLARSKGAREALVARAQLYVNEHAEPSGGGGAPPLAGAPANANAQAAPNRADTKAEIERQVDDLRSLDIPLGWSSVFDPPPNAPLPDRSGFGWLTRIFGLIVTMFAISLGAPFWFDALKHIMAIRSTVKPDEQQKKDEKPAPVQATPAALFSAVTSATAPTTVGAGAAAGAATPVAPSGYTAHQWAAGAPDEGIL